MANINIMKVIFRMENLMERGDLKQDVKKLKIRDGKLETLSIINFTEINNKIVDQLFNYETKTKYKILSNLQFLLLGFNQLLKKFKSYWRIIFIILIYSIYSI